VFGGKCNSTTKKITFQLKMTVACLKYLEKGRKERRGRKNIKEGDLLG